VKNSIYGRENRGVIPIYRKIRVVLDKKGVVINKDNALIERDIP